MDDIKRFGRKLMVQAEANPIAALVVGAMVVTACSKFMDANTARLAAKTHAAEVARRIANSK